MSAPLTGQEIQARAGQRVHPGGVLKGWRVPDQPDLRERIANLSRERRALLEQRLLERHPARGRDADIPRREPGSPCPLSFAQQRLWFMHQLAPHAAAYNIARAMRLQGRLDVSALRRALDAIVERHEVLRTTFVAADPEPLQVIGVPRPVDLRVVDLAADTAPARERELSRLLTEEARRPFDLERDLMLRGLLVRQGHDDHALLLTQHHIASDGWSTGVLLRELATLYEADREGRTPVVPPLPIQYADYAIWQRRVLAREAFARQLEYWRGRLEGAPPALELPTDRQRPAVQSYHGARRARMIPAALAARLADFSRRERATLFMTLLAAFQTLLQRYTDQADVVVGSVIAGRTRRETEALIGLFVNTLVIRSDLSGDPSFRTALGRVREVALGAYANQDMPFEQLVHALRPERRLDRSPLVQVLFVLQDGSRPLMSLGGLTTTTIDVEMGAAQFDLGLSVTDTAEGLQVRTDYCVDLFDAETIGRLLGHYETLLESIVAEPARRLSALPLLPDAERRQVLEWSGGSPSHSTDQCLHRLVETQAARTPDATAVVGDDGRLTYRELDGRANQLARHLMALGVGPDTLVGLAVERSCRMVVALLGVLKAGGAYVPLDPGYPAERLQLMLEDSRVTVLLTEEPVLAAFHAPPARVVCVDRDWPRIAAWSTAAADGGATPDTRAYVVFTSGSTGRPKGVEIEHRAVVNLLLAMAETVGFAASDTLLAVTTLSFDIAALELYLPLCVGGRVIVASRALAADGMRLAAALQSGEVTVMQATPANWRLLVEAGWRAAPGFTILCGGEVLPRDLADALLQRGARLWNLYGPTETTIWSTCHLVERGAGPVSIGRPIAGTRALVLDSELAPVPTGVPGELCIGGVGVARGYLGRPDLTAERFVPDPWAGEPDARLYRTGDVARQRPGGTLEYLGRRDQQVKLRGFRVELGEVEAALARHPAVSECAVLVREAAPGDPRLVAYVTSRVEPRPAAGELRAFLRRLLPEYMVPSAIVLLDALPVTPNGKLDRRALPEPGQPDAPREREFIGPRDALERQLVRLWEKVIGVAPIGITDDFFDLGGHSLLAVRLVSQIQDATGKSVALATFFQQRTIEHLATALRWEQGADPLATLVPLQLHGSRPPLYVGGSNPAYSPLARHLGLDQPFYALDVYALQGHRLRAGQKPFGRIEAIAAYFVDRIREMQPTGPYFLAGGCEGAVVAFEIGRQLQRRGERIGLLSIWETAAPKHLRRSMVRLYHHAWALFRKRSIFRPNRRELLAALRHEYIEYSIFRAIDRYVPQDYDGRLLVVRGSESPTRRGDPTMGWGELATQGADILLVPGTHLTFLTANAREFGERLKGWLAGPVPAEPASTTQGPGAEGISDETATRRDGTRVWTSSPAADGICAGDGIRERRR